MSLLAVATVLGYPVSAVLGAAAPPLFRRRAEQKHEHLTEAQTDNTIADTWSKAVAQRDVELTRRDTEIAALREQIGKINDRLEQAAAERQRAEQHCDQRLDAMESRHKAEMDSLEARHKSELLEIREERDRFVAYTNARIDELNRLNIALQSWALERRPEGTPEVQGGKGR